MKDRYKTGSIIGILVLVLTTSFFGLTSRRTNIYPYANVVQLPDANHFTQEDNPESYYHAIRAILSTIEEDKL